MRRPATWIQARDFAEIPNVPDWNDWSVRFAGAYDLFGNGKTALKANASKYIAAAAAGYAQNFNPHDLLARRRARWVDFDGNKSILDAAGNIQFNEVIGGTSNFGQITNRPDPDLQRGYNWEYSASVQHELMERVSVTAGYYRRQFYNLDVIDNLNLAVTDWTPFGDHDADRSAAAAVGPADHDVHPERQQGRRGDRQPAHLLGRSTAPIYNGFEFSANLRRDKLLLFGGITTERAVDRLRRLDHRDDDRARQPEQRCASATRCRRSAPPSRCRRRISCRGTSS